MDEAEYELARNCYGYGRWEAPYWFIGPEQGQSSDENNDIKRRYEAFLELDQDKDGLCDCREFHDRIFNNKSKWHSGIKPPLQQTWRCLILLLMSYLGKPEDKDYLRSYQRDSWGSSKGDTCVIELSGLPARNFVVSKERERKLFAQEEIDAIRRKRINFIYGKMLKLIPKPKFVVIYSKRQEEWWRKIPDFDLHSSNIIFAPHPRGTQNQCWINLGKKLQNKLNV